MIQKVIVSGIIEKNNKLLVVKRSAAQDFFPGYYEFPGGKVDFGEHPNTAVLREIREETGLNTKILGFYTCRSYLSKNNSQHNIELFYLLQLKSADQTEIVLSPEHEAYLWVDLMNIHETNLPLTDPVYLIIVNYFNGNHSFDSVNSSH